MFWSMDLRDQQDPVLALSLPHMAVVLRQEHLSLNFLIGRMQKAVVFTSLSWCKA